MKLGFFGYAQHYVPDPLLTDGPRLYFMERPNGNAVAAMIAQVSAEGSDTVHFPTTRYSTTLLSPQLLDISPDRTQLLVGSRLEGEFPLFVLPLLGGSPRHLANLLGHDATWTPDGQGIVYANGQDLLVVQRQGYQPRELGALPGIAHWLRWSPDGTRLRFTLTDSKTNTSSIWEMLHDGTLLHPLLSHWNDPPAECCGNWTNDGRYFLFQSAKNNRTQIFAIQEKTSLLRKVTGVPTQLTAGPLNYFTPVPSLDGRRVFVVGSQPRGELLRFDSKSQEFVHSPSRRCASRTGMGVSPRPTRSCVCDGG
jgi:Tol biopolymer transport system component